MKIKTKLKFDDKIFNMLLFDKPISDELIENLKSGIIRQPEFKQPEFEQPEIEQPEIEQPEFKQPEIEQPEIEQPEFKQPEIEQPEIEQPEIEQPEIKPKEIGPKIKQKEVQISSKFQNELENLRQLKTDILNNSEFTIKDKINQLDNVLDLLNELEYATEENKKLFEDEQTNISMLREQLVETLEDEPLEDEPSEKSIFEYKTNTPGNLGIEFVNNATINTSNLKELNDELDILERKNFMDNKKFQKTLTYIKNEIYKQTNKDITSININLFDFLKVIDDKSNTKISDNFINFINKDFINGNRQIRGISKYTQDLNNKLDSLANEELFNDFIEKFKNNINNFKNNKNKLTKLNSILSIIKKSNENNKFTSIKTKTKRSNILNKIKFN